MCIKEVKAKKTSKPNRGNSAVVHCVIAQSEERKGQAELEQVFVKFGGNQSARKRRSW